MRLVLAGAVAFGVQLVPGVRSQDVVDVLDLVVAPDGLVDVVPAQRLERVVNVGQGHPAAPVQLTQQALVGKFHGRGVVVHVVDNLLEELGRRIDDLQAAVHEAEGAHSRVGADGLGRLWVVVLRGEGAVGGDPVLGVVGFLERVADAGVACGEDALAGAGVPAGGGLRVVELHGHELVHVVEDEHVAVELDDAVILGQAEGGQLAPAVVEARVVGVVLGRLGGEQVFDLLVGDAAGVEGVNAFLGEGLCVQGYERVGGFVLLEGVVQGEKTGEVFCVCDEGCPDCVVVSLLKRSGQSGRVNVSLSCMLTSAGVNCSFAVSHCVVVL